MSAAEIQPLAPGWRQLCAKTDHRPARAVQINTLRRRVNGTVELLASLLGELEDLHVLAYDRPRLAEEVVVSGGQADYALDTHGDIRARDAYRDLGAASIHALDVITEAADAVSRILRAGDSPTRTRSPRTAKAIDLGVLLANRATRIATDDGYEPVRRHPQPDRDEALRALRDKAEEERRKQLTGTELDALDALLNDPDTKTHGRARRILRDALTRLQPPG